MCPPTSRPSLLPALAAKAHRRLSTQAVSRLAAERGMAGIEWCSAHVPPGARGTAERVTESTRDAGLRVAAYAASWNGDHSLLRAVLDAAVALEAPTIRLGATGLAGVFAGDLPHVRDALDVVEAAGLTVSLSYLPAAFYTTLRLVREIAHPSLRLCWRVSNAQSEDGLPCRLHGLRFSVPGVRAGELTMQSGRRIPEVVLRSRVLHAEERFAVFDAVPSAETLQMASSI